MTTAKTVMPTRDVTIGDTFVRISGQGFSLVSTDQQTPV
jgi:hypothetical protein